MKTSVSLTPGGRRDLCVALQVSGHLKSCGDASKLQAHVDACRRAFATCDIFVSTWSELKPTTMHWSGSRAVTRRRWTPAEFEAECVRPFRKVATAMRVDAQPPPDARSAREPAGERKWGPERHHGWTMNVLGMLRAAELRRAHNGSRAYDLAVRLRPDGLEWGPWMTPTEDDRRTTYECMARLWTGSSTWATAGRLAVHSCHPHSALGGLTSDNCFFGAPPKMDALLDELGRQRDLGGRPFRWIGGVGQPELGIAHVAEAVGVPIGEQCTREVLRHVFDKDPSLSIVVSPPPPPPPPPHPTTHRVRTKAVNQWARYGCAHPHGRSSWSTARAFGVCCPEACGSCGGKGCDSRPGGRDACCAATMRPVLRGRSCVAHAAPCLQPYSPWLLEPQRTKESCPSLRYEKAWTASLAEAYPIFLGSASSMVCRTPKVGTTLLRAVWRAVEYDLPFREAATWQRLRDIIPPEPARIAAATSLLLLARRPATRILSGMETIRGRVAREGGCEAFIERVVAPNYDESCRNARKFIVDDALQHVLPPVRCRCGLECGGRLRNVTIVRVEENDVHRVLAGIAGASRAPPTATVRIRPHGAAHGAASLNCTPRAIARLEQITTNERRFLGYAV